jgi:hypothetical protein
MAIHQGGTKMKDYRVYVLGSDGHIVERVEFFASDDEAAKERAKQIVNGRDIELWHRDHKIAEFKSQH